MCPEPRSPSEAMSSALRARRPPCRQCGERGSSASARAPIASQQPRIAPSSPRAAKVGLAPAPATGAGSAVRSSVTSRGHTETALVQAAPQNHADAVDARAPSCVWCAGWRTGRHGAAWRRRRPERRGPGRSQCRHACPVASLRATRRRCGSTQLSHPSRARIGSAGPGTSPRWWWNRDGLQCGWVSAHAGGVVTRGIRERMKPTGFSLTGRGVDRRLSMLMDPAPQQVGVDAVSHCHRARPLRRPAAATLALPAS